MGGNMEASVVADLQGLSLCKAELKVKDSQ